MQVNVFESSFSGYKSLYREFCNYVSLGHWEMARACTFNMFQIENCSGGKSSVMGALKSLASNPWLSRFSWQSLLSPSYISFLSCIFMEKFGRDQEEVDSLCRAAEFHILLEILLPDVSEDVWKDLSSLYYSKGKCRGHKVHDSDKISSQNENEGTSRVLKNIMLNDPCQTSVLLEKLLYHEKSISYFNAVNGKICGVYWHCLLHYLGQLDPSFENASSDQTHLSKIVKSVHLLLSLIPDAFDEFKPGEKMSVDNTVELIISMCISKIFDQKDIYLSLLGRQSPKLLKWFSFKEDEYYNRSVNTARELGPKTWYVISTNGSLNHCEALLWSLKSGSHFLEHIVNCAVEAVLEGKAPDMLHLWNDSVLSCLQPLVLILAWESCIDDTSAANVITAIKSADLLGAPSKNIFLEYCCKLQYNANATDWLINCLREKRQDIAHFELFNRTRNIFTQLQGVSPLRLFHKIFGLQSVSASYILELLNMKPKGIFNQEPRNCGLTDKDIFHGYLAMTYMMDAIYFSLELQNILTKVNSSNLTPPGKATDELTACDSSNSQFENNTEVFTGVDMSFKTDKVSLYEYVVAHGFHAAFEHFVLRMLKKCRQEIKNILVYTFRVEILENLFSLLFLTKNDFCDINGVCSDSDDGYEGEDKLLQRKYVESPGTSAPHTTSYSWSRSLSTDKSCITFQERSVSSGIANRLNQNSEFVNRYSGQFVFSTAKLKDSEDVKEEANEICSGPGSSWSTGSNSSNTLATTCFLCSELIVKELLLIMKDSILALEAEWNKIPKSEQDSSKEQVKNRFSKLLQLVREAQWRYDLVHSENFRAVYQPALVVSENAALNTFFSDDFKYPLDMLEGLSISGTANKPDTALKRKRKKRKRSSESFSSSDCAKHEPDIIQRMLSTPDALIRYSMWRGNSVQAEQVIELFKLKNSVEAKELCFSNNMCKLKARIVNYDKSRSAVNGNLPKFESTHSMSAIAQEVLCGISCTSVVSFIEQQLNIIGIPEETEFSTKVKSEGLGEQDFISGSKNLHSIILSDLSFTASVSLELSSVLLDMALKKWEERQLHKEQSGTKKKHISSDNKKFIGSMIFFFKEVKTFSTSDSDNSLVQVFFPFHDAYKISFSSIFVNYIGIFDGSQFSNHKYSWEKCALIIDEHVELFSKDSTRTEISLNSKNSNYESSRNDIHTSFKNVIKSVRNLSTWTKDVIKPWSDKYIDYLNTLFLHLKQVTEALHGYSSQLQGHNSQNQLTDEQCSSYFSVLRKSPYELLMKIVTETGNIPERVEKLASDMKMDMVHVLTQCYFPSIPLLHVNAPISRFFSSSRSTVGNAGFPCIILNDSPEKSQSSRHPCLVAKELLEDFLHMIEAFTNAKGSGILSYTDMLSLCKHPSVLIWESKCSELAGVDLNLLQSRVEKLSFFVNVTNIAWLHAVLDEISVMGSFGFQESEVACHFHLSCEENFCDNRIGTPMCHITSTALHERLIRQKVVGYCIGQLGVISLFDLRYQVLHMHVSSPKHLGSSPFSRLLDKPKEQWIKYAPPAEPRLIFVLCECILSSPRLQVMDYSTFNEQLEDAMKDFLNFTVKVDEQNYKVEFPQLLEWYALDLEGTYETDVNRAEFEGLVDLVSTFLRGCLAQSLHFLLSLDFLHGFSENIDHSGKNQLPFLLEFSPGSAEFGIILEYVPSINATECTAETTPTNAPNSLQSNVLTYLKEKCWLLIELYNFIDKDTKELTENTYLHSNTNSNLNCKNDLPVERLLTLYKALWSKTSCDTDEALQWFVSSLSPLPQKEFILQQIEKCFLIGEWETLLEYTYIFIALRKDRVAEFSLLLQLTLHHLCSEVPKTELQFLEPWSCAMCIPDSSVRAECILKNVPKWPEASAIQALKYCLVTCSKDRATFYDAVDMELKKILVYKKILDSCKTKKIDAKQHFPVFSSWQQFAESCVKDQSAVIKCLEGYKLYELAVEWCQLHSVESQHEMDALALQILCYFEGNSTATQGVYKVLNGLDALESIALCKRILPKISSLANKLCIVQYLTSINLEYPEKKHYYNMLFGLKILLAMSSADEESYLILTEYPLLLLEQLLMNKEVNEAIHILQAVFEELKSQNDLGIQFNQESINKLVEKYAFKAIELRTVDIELESSASGSSTLGSEDPSQRSDQFVMPSSVPAKNKWVEDSKVQICQLCQEEQFNMFCRRHHCRRCGRVICSSCSQNTLIVEGYGKVGVRVCDDCFNQTTLSTSAEKRQSVFVSARRPSSFQNSLFQSVHVTFDPVQHLKQKNLRWQLSPEEEQNISVRNEFLYEEAPSISLCLSILKLHLDTGMCAKFMLTLCDHLVSQIKPSPDGKTFAEVDHSLVISMVKALLLNAKMKYHDIQNIDDVAEIDTYFQCLDIIQLLVNDNCRHLIPRELTSIETVRKLCDKLVEEERMSLAQEVSTKCGLEKGSVYKAWGLYYLRAGCWTAAREKFKKCLQIPKDRSKQKQDDPFLHKIIMCLEESKYCSGEEAPAVYNALESLQSIRKGAAPVKSEKTTFDDQNKEECLYYLLTYGTHTSIVSFYQRHGLLSDTLNYILEKKCHPDIFVDAVFMPSLKSDQLTSLQLLLQISDPHLSNWRSYLIHTCRYLQRFEFFNVLNNMQVFMKDYIRAAKSSINFYLARADSYSDLHEHLHHLRKARSLLEEYLRDNPMAYESNLHPVAKKMILTLPAKEIESYIRTIELQEEVSHFFHFCNMQNVDSTFYTYLSGTKVKILDSSHLPTLFGSEKPQVTIMILVHSLKIRSGFDLSLKIIKEYGLNATSVITSAVHLLNFLKRSDNIPSFLLCIKNTFGNTINLDEVTMECISMTVDQEYQAQYFDELLKFLVSDANKINAYLRCGKLKSAFLLAVKLNSPMDVTSIMKSAEESGQQAIKIMCEKWLQTHT